MDELKTWAGNEPENEPENRTPTGSISHSFVEAELDSESDISFAIIPSDVQPEVENVDRKSPIQNVKSEIGIIEDRSNSQSLKLEKF